jgi:hypothetical protein
MKKRKIMPSKLKKLEKRKKAQKHLDEISGREIHETGNQQVMFC